MVAFVKSDIPDSINTLEKLAVWAGTVLNDLHTGLSVVESSDYMERAAQSAPYLITAVDPAVWRVITRTSIELQPQWRRSGKIWEYAKELSTQSIPTEFKS